MTDHLHRMPLADPENSFVAQLITQEQYSVVRSTGWTSELILDPFRTQQLSSRHNSWNYKGQGSYVVKRGPSACNMDSAALSDGRLIESEDRSCAAGKNGARAGVSSFKHAHVEGILNRRGIAKAATWTTAYPPNQIQHTPFPCSASFTKTAIASGPCALLARIVPACRTVAVHVSVAGNALKPCSVSG